MQCQLCGLWLGSWDKKCCCNFFIFLGLGSLLILRLFGLLPLDVSLGGPSDGGTSGSIVVSVVLVELEGSWLMTSILFLE